MRWWLSVPSSLQINNWNQNRLERKEEQVALRNLLEDFTYNKQSLLQAAHSLKRMMASGHSILENTGNKSKTGIELKLDSLLISSTSTPRYFPQNGFLNDLINSGKLSLIQNDRLRNYLSSWDTNIALIADRTAINHSHSIKITDYVTKHGNWLRADAKYGLKYIQLPPSGFETSNLPLLQHPEFESLIELKLVFKDQLLDRYYESLEVCEKVLKLIKEELE